MNITKKKKLTKDWLTSKKIVFIQKDDHETFGECEVYVKETKTKKWQFDLYDDFMDITLTTWDSIDNMKDIIEMTNIPFATFNHQLDSLLELTHFKIK